METTKTVAVAGRFEVEHFDFGTGFSEWRVTETTATGGYRILATYHASKRDEAIAFARVQSRI